MTERQKSYGNNFTYQEHAFHKSWSKALFSTLGLGLLGLTLVSPLRKIVRSFLRKPGEGPSLEVQENGWFDCKYLVENEDGQKSLYRMFGKGDPGIKLHLSLLLNAHYHYLKIQKLFQEAQSMEVS